jgi:hypothetical protein
VNIDAEGVAIIRFVALEANLAYQLLARSTSDQARACRPPTRATFHWSRRDTALPRWFT